MQIALQPPSGSLVWLAGEPGVREGEFSSASEVDIDPQALLQEDVFVRGPVAKFKDRGNLKTTIRWNTVRKFDTAEQASEFLLDYDNNFPREGTLILNIPQTTGGVITRSLPNAVVSPPRRRQLGVSVFLSYQAQGGAISTPSL